MLERLLTLVRRGGSQTPESLARQLGVTPGLVHIMLSDLEQRGYIVQSGVCAEACTGCDAAGGCGQNGVQRLWTVQSA